MFFFFTSHSTCQLLKCACQLTCIYFLCKFLRVKREKTCKNFVKHIHFKEVPKSWTREDPMPSISYLWCRRSKPKYTWWFLTSSFEERSTGYNDRSDGATYGWLWKFHPIVGQKSVISSNLWFFRNIFIRKKHGINYIIFYARSYNGTIHNVYRNLVIW